MEVISLVEMSSTNSETVVCAIEKVLCEKDIGIEKRQFYCQDSTNSMLGEYNVVQRGMWNHAPHAVYINCRCHRLALCFKHLINDFPLLNTKDSLLLGLWKTFHFSSKKHVLKEI